MRLARRYGVPEELALLYDFVNTLDERRYVEGGAAHAGGDELATPRHLESWMRARRLLRAGEHVNAADHRRALDLRDALRGFLQLPPADRRQNTGAARRLTALSRGFPLTLMVADDAVVTLRPAPGSSALGRVLSDVYGLASTGQLGRLKACASEECRWIFFDRSKPANRRWCSSALCGNRQKTRAYRHRHRDARRGERTSWGEQAG